MLRRITNAVLPPNAPRNATSRPLTNAQRNLARWIGQVAQDTSGFALPRLVQETDYSRLFWEMWLHGLALRINVGHALNRKYKRNIAPDPLRPLAFSYRATIEEAARQLGVTLLYGTAENGLSSVADGLMERSGRRTPLYAWLETYPARMREGVPYLQPPDLIVLGDSPTRPFYLPDGALIEMPYWCAHAACVLGKYDKDHGLYTGLAAPGDRVLPPDPEREPSYTPILHMFAKALLGTGRACPPRAACQCASVLAILDTPPAAHPGATGVWDAPPPGYGNSYSTSYGPSGTYGRSAPRSGPRTSGPIERERNEHN